jgi:CRP/FNR family cyclic AMP-dependent transcriptional regulator
MKRRIQFTPEIEAMIAASKHYRVAPREMIVNRGEIPTDIFFIIRGSVAVMVEHEDGHELIISYLGPGEFFGELGLFSDTALRSAWISARTECELVRIEYQRFKVMLRADPELLMQLTGQLAQRLRNTSEKLGDLAFLDVTGRVASTLLQLCQDSQAITHPDGMLLRITRQELGRLVNCSRQMATRVLQTLEAQGLIKVEGKSIIVYRSFSDSDRDKSVNQFTGSAEISA